jgi:hypothetical protein
LEGRDETAHGDQLGYGARRCRCSAGGRSGRGLERCTGKHLGHSNSDFDLTDERFLKADAYARPTTIAGVLPIAQGSGCCSGDQAQRKQLSGEIQKLALSQVAYVPWGEWVQPTALRKNVRDVVGFGAPVFWNVKIS